MQKVIKSIIGIIVISLITIIILEILLQVMFLSLPTTIIQRMPQYPERYGIRFDTSHGAREYPSEELVNFEVNQYTGDLFQVSCLSPKNAQYIDPYIVNYQRDAHGFRTPLLSTNEADIVIVGDSFTAAESIVTPYWEEISDSIVVLGLPGSGTLEQKILIEEFGLQYNPKVIVLAYFGGNDLTDNQTFYRLQEDGLTFSDKTHQGRSPLEYLVTFHLLLFARDTLNSSSQVDCNYPMVAKTTPPTPIAFFDRMVSLLTIDRGTLANSNEFKITATSIIEFANLAESSNAEFVLAYIPQKAEVYWNLLDEANQESITNNLTKAGIDIIPSQINANLDVQRKLIENLAQDNNFYFLDFTPFLANQAITGQSPYFFADTHWNQTGHDLAKSALLDYLSQLTLDKNGNS